MNSRSVLSLSAAACAVFALAGCDPTSSDASTATASEVQIVEVEITDGYDTNPVDNGRPVVLVASLLGVEPTVFRDAFSGVTPAAGGDTPDGEQVQQNKAALLAVLEPYGISNDDLDTASDRYRYLASAGETWERRDATATATVENGVVTDLVVTDPGRGYTSTPTITVALPNGSTVTGTATVEYTADFETNGSISSISLG